MASSSTRREQLSDAEGEGDSPTDESGAATSDGASWDLFDRLREAHVPSSAAPSDVYRIPSSVAPTDDGDGDGSGSSSDYYDLRHLTYMNPFIDADLVPGQVHVDATVAAMMALHHFNHGIGDAIGELSDVAARCRTRFTMDFIDTRLSPIVASRALLKDVFARDKNATNYRAEKEEEGKWAAGAATDAGPDADGQGVRRRNGAKRSRRRTSDHFENYGDRQRLPVPTAIIGATRSAVSTPLAILGATHNLPQISFISTSTELDNRDQFPFFGRVVPSAATDATFAVEYLSNVLRASHFGILYVRDPYGTSYAQAVQNAAAEVRPFPVKIGVAASIPLNSPSLDARRASIAEAVQQLKESGLRYFFGIYFESDYFMVAREAYRQGIAGPGYFWIFTDGLLDLQGRKYDTRTESDLIEAGRGSAMIATASLDVLQGKRGYGAFLRHWEKLREPQSSGRAFFDSKVRHHFDAVENGDRLAARLEFSKVPSSFALLSYDAVIAAAIAVCDATIRNAAFSDEDAADDGFGRNAPVEITGEDVFACFLNVSFCGLYGEVSIDASTGSRVAETVPYTISNLLFNPGNNGTITMDLVATNVRGVMEEECAVRENSHPSKDGGGYATSSSWRTLRPFIYSDGTTQAPPELPVLEHNPHRINAVTLAAGYAMCALVVLTSIFFSTYTYRHRRCPVILSAQPVFLYILTTGTLMMGMSIIPMGIEETASLQIGRGVACMATPWLLTVGFSLSFAALWAKEQRTRRVTKRDMRRVRVTAMQVMKPAAVLVGMNILGMIVWTVVAPLQYVRTDVVGSVDEFMRATESYGACALPSDPSDPGKSWWVGIFLVWIISVGNGSLIVAALYRCYETRHIETSFSESRYIALSIASIVQAWLIGIPLLFIGTSCPSALFIIFSAIIFIMCQSILILLFAPKVYFVKKWKIKQKKRESERKRKMQTPSWMAFEDDSRHERLDVLASEMVFHHDRVSRSDNVGTDKKLEMVVESGAYENVASAAAVENTRQRFSLRKGGDGKNKQKQVSFLFSNPPSADETPIVAGLPDVTTPICDADLHKSSRRLSLVSLDNLSIQSNEMEVGEARVHFKKSRTIKSFR